MLDVASPLHWAIIIATFLVAGGVKGVVGLGLPTVSLAAFTFAFGLKTAMALMVVPSLITNIAQMLQGPALGRLTRALWPFLVAACVGTFVGVAMLVHADERWLALLLGVLIICYALANLLPSVQRFRKPPSGSQPQAPPPQSTGPQADAGGTVTGTLVGLVNGILTGLTGSFVVPGVPYLRRFPWSRDVFIQAMGLLFTVSTAALALALGGSRALTSDLVWLSTLGVIPALIGMALGAGLRGRINDGQFRAAMLLALLAAGAGLALRSALQLA